MFNGENGFFLFLNKYLVCMYMYFEKKYLFILWILKFNKRGINLKYIYNN